MVLTVSAADLAAEVEFTLTTSLIEPTALGVDGATGSAPEVGHAWFTADLADNFLGSVVVTPEVPEDLQVELGVYGAEGQLLGGGTGTDVLLCSCGDRLHELLLTLNSLLRKIKPSR